MRFKQSLKRKIKIISTGLLGCVLLLGLALLALAPTYVDSIVFSRFPPEQLSAMKQAYREWQTKPLTLPSEALTAAPFSSETQRAARVFAAIWKSMAEQAETLAKEVENHEETQELLVDATLKKRLAGMEGLLLAFTDLVRCPDYSIMAFPSGHDPIYSGIPIGRHFSGVKECAWLLRLKAVLAMHEGRQDEALATMETCLRAAQAGPYDLLGGQVLAEVVCAIGTDSWSEMLRDCKDATFLRRNLAAQARLAGGFQFLSDPSLPTQSLCDIGMLREARCRGVIIDYQGSTQRELAVKVLESEVAHMEEAELPRLKNDPEEAQRMRESIKDYRKEIVRGGGAGGGLMRPFWRFSGRLEEPLRFQGAHSSVTRKNTAGDRERRKFAQLRLETARKLFSLEHGKAPEKDTDLVPDYLERLPVR